MSNASNISELEKAEHLATTSGVGLKRSAMYIEDGGNMRNLAASDFGGGGIPANKATDAYGYQAKSLTATHKYYFYEDGNGAWYILRNEIATGIVSYAKGTGGYASVYVDSTSAPSSGTFASYDATFDNVGASSLSFDTDGNLEVALTDLTHDNVHTSVKELRVYSEGHVCAQNSTSTPLGINGVFTGDWQDTLDYSEIIVSIGTDKSSITNGLVIQWSADAINVNGDDTYTISANSDKTFSFPCQRRYVRIIYTNDGIAQTVFNLSTILKRFASKGSSHRLTDNLNQEDDAIVTKSMIAGFTTAGGGGIVNVKVNPSGALTVDIGASVLPTGASTSDNQTNGNQKAKVYLTDEFGTQSQMLCDNLYAGAPVTIDVSHHEIHCGDSFVATRTVDLANGASDTIIITVPNETGSKLYHLTIDINTESETQFDVYEGATTAADGTTVTNINRNRNSILTSALAITHTPTTPAAGTNIYTEHWGAGKQSGGEQRGTHEMILKNNTKYRLVLTNSTTTANYVSWKFNHYIHPGV